jgi:hypothetical protein
MMEEWLIFSVVLSPYIMDNVGAPEDVLKMWGLLRRAVVYLLRYQPGQHSCERI